MSSSSFLSSSGASWFSFFTTPVAASSSSASSKSPNAVNSQSLPIPHRLKSHPNVRVFRDIPYTSSSSAFASTPFTAEPQHSRHLLDIYAPVDVLRSPSASITESKSDVSSSLTPSSSSSSVPVLLYVHGGGWVRGDKKSNFRGAPGVGRTMSENGVVTVCISYRLAKASLFSLVIRPFLFTLILSLLVSLISFTLSSFIPNIQSWFSFFYSYSTFPFVFLIILALTFLWPVFSGYVFPLVPKFARYGTYQYQQQLEDVAQAILFVKKNLKQLVPQADTENIFLAGHSAGAHLITQLAFTHDSVFKAVEKNNARVKKNNELMDEQNPFLPVQPAPSSSSSSSSTSFNFLRNIRGIIAISGVYYLQNPFSDNPGDLKNRLFRATYGWGAFGCDPRILDQASPLYHLQQRNHRVSVSSSAASARPLPALPPFLVFSAESDLGLEYDANRFVSALSHSDIRHRFVNVANSSHASIASRFETHDTKDAMMQFIKEELDTTHTMKAGNQFE